jgi:hypothetical protein
VGETIELDRIWNEIVGKNKAKNKPVNISTNYLSR